MLAFMKIFMLSILGINAALLIVLGFIIFVTILVTLAIIHFINNRKGGHP